ncbi:hypothetical protein KR059_004517 [Drosophila kikkawai]|nr:hypothetical protein KR059_004517 [Drosophila kikkawai]
MSATMAQITEEGAPAVSSMEANPPMDQNISEEHQQGLPQIQYLQQQYYYGGPQSPWRVPYNHPSWCPRYGHRHHQCWYCMPHVSRLQVCHPNSAMTNNIAPLFSELSNGGQCQCCSAWKNQAELSAIQDRTKAGGRSCLTQETSDACSLNVSESSAIYKIKAESSSRASKKSKANNRKKASSKKLATQGQDTEDGKKQIYKEKEEEPSLVNGASSLIEIKPINSQAFSACSSVKKRRFFSRLFGGIDSRRQAQTKPASHVQDPTKVHSDNIDHLEVREADGSKKLRAARQSKKRKDNNRSNEK